PLNRVVPPWVFRAVFHVLFRHVRGRLPGSRAGRIFVPYRKGFETNPRCSNNCTVILSIRLQQFWREAKIDFLLSVSRKHFYLISKLFRNLRIRIGRVSERVRVDRVAEIKLDCVEPETAAAWPGFECPANANGNDRHTQFESKNRCTLLKLCDT